jgi:hypothetical protein
MDGLLFHVANDLDTNLNTSKHAQIKLFV